jgi:hypothetical protein
MSGHDPKVPPPESVPPLTAMPTVAAESNALAPHAYLVVMDRGGIFGAYLEAALALEIAQNIDGVVCTVPVA